MLATVWFVLAMIRKAFRLVSRRHPRLEHLLYFFSRVCQAAAVVVGFLVLLGGLGAKLTPVLGALGLGGLAGALALQDTLINFFAGIYIMVEQKVRLGDRIKSAGVEGEVIGIGWRTTQLRGKEGQTMILPNKHLTQALLINYDLPEEAMETKEVVKKENHE